MEVGAVPVGIDILAGVFVVVGTGVADSSGWYGTYEFTGDGTVQSGPLAVRRPTWEVREL